MAESEDEEDDRLSRTRNRDKESLGKIEDLCAQLLLNRGKSGIRYPQTDKVAESTLNVKKLKRLAKLIVGFDKLSILVINKSDMERILKHIAEKHRVKLKLKEEHQKDFIIGVASRIRCALFQWKKHSSKAKPPAWVAELRQLAENDTADGDDGDSKADEDEAEGKKETRGRSKDRKKCKKEKRAKKQRTDKVKQEKTDENAVDVQPKGADKGRKQTDPKKTERAFHYDFCHETDRPCRHLLNSAEKEFGDKLEDYPPGIDEKDVDAYRGRFADGGIHEIDSLTVTLARQKIEAKKLDARGGTATKNDILWVGTEAATNHAVEVRQGSDHKVILFIYNQSRKITSMDLSSFVTDENPFIKVGEKFELFPKGSPVIEAAVQLLDPILKKYCDGSLDEAAMKKEKVIALREYKKSKVKGSKQDPATKSAIDSGKCRKVERIEAGIDMVNSGLNNATAERKLIEVSPIQGPNSLPSSASQSFGPNVASGPYSAIPPSCFDALFGLS
jgi:hypothetical protein